jgi:hypothetical protein
MRAHLFFVLFLAACSSSSSTPSGGTTGDGGSSGSSGSSGDTGGGCKVTFGGAASSVTAKGCSQMGPFASESTAFEWHGDADGLDDPLYSFTLKYPNGITAKKYETKDMYYVSSSLGVGGKNYFVDFDSTDATKARHGSVTTNFTSDQHGTADIVLESDDTPPAQATVHVEF